MRVGSRGLHTPRPAVGVPSQPEPADSGFHLKLRAPRQVTVTVEIPATVPGASAGLV